MSGLDGLGEFGLIRALTQGLPQTDSVVCGVGDDCAVVQFGDTQILLSCDAVVENIHFRRDWAAPEAIGWKAAAAALSDIAAMGGTARCILTTLGCEHETSPSFLKAVYAGIDALVREYDVAIVGGDTVRTQQGLMLDITAVGEVNGAAAPKYRRNAKPGDIVAVTGYPGAAALGLAALERGDKGPESLIEAHVRPRPQLAAGAWLGREPAVHAMIDISDGLASDLGHIATCSNVSIAIESAALPASADMHRYAEKIGRSIAACALGGGEDYELAFTIAPEHATSLKERFCAAFDLPLAFIGAVHSGAAAVLVDDAPVPAKGYNHFQPEK